MIQMVSIPLRGKGYRKTSKKLIGYGDYEFPSPCGVKVIERSNVLTREVELPFIMFPSPCGVKVIESALSKVASESDEFPSPCGVKVIERLRCRLYAGKGFQRTNRRNKFVLINNRLLLRKISRCNLLKSTPWKGSTHLNVKSAFQRFGLLRRAHRQKNWGN